MRPVHQVAGLHQHDAGILLPAVLGYEHIRGHDVVATILAAQDVRVANTAALADAVRGDNRPVLVQCIPVAGIFAHGKAQLLLQVLVAATLKVGKQVAGKLWITRGLFLRLHAECEAEQYG